MSYRSIPVEASVRPGELDEILAEFSESGIRPSRLNILARALDRGNPEDFAVVVADAAERTEACNAGYTRG